jgi:hypothetical protein
MSGPGGGSVLVEITRPRDWRWPVAENRLTQRLLSDLQLTLADDLKLPAFPLEGARWYRRLIILASHGRIEKAFFPVTNPAARADQALAWMTIQGVSWC